MKIGSNALAPSLWLAAWLLWLPVVGPPAQAALKRPLLDELSLPARATFQAAFPGAPVTEVQLTNENGLLVFVIEVQDQGWERYVTVSAEGSLLSRQLLLHELPPAVRPVVAREIKGGKGVEIFWTNEEGEPAYYVECQRDSRRHSAVFAPDGELLSRELAWAEAPPAVQKAIHEKLRGRQPARVDLAMEDGDTTYEVTAHVNGRDRLWIFNPDGTVAAEPVEIREIPEPARARLVREVADAPLLRYLKYTLEGRIHYEVAYVRKEKRHACTVDETGQVISEEVPLSELPAAVQSAMTREIQDGFLMRIERSPAAEGPEYELFFRRNHQMETRMFSATGVRQ